MKKGGIILGLVISILLGVSLPLVVSVIDHGINPPPEEEYIPLDPEFLEKPKDGTSPKDHSIIDNFRIAGGVLSRTDNFKTIQEGNAISEMVLKNNQEVKATRIVNKDKAYVTHTTSSSFVESSVERFYLEDKVLVRNSSFENKTPVFDDNLDPYSYSYDYILDNLGWLPFSMTSYIINEDTIVSSKVIESEHFYTMELMLDLDESISHTKREIRYNANALSYPKYQQVKVSISLDDDWRVLEIKTEDVYDLTVKMGINLTVPVESNLVEKFYYEDCDLSSISSYSYFSQYLEEEIDDEEEIVKEKGAVDYLFNVAFSLILNGSSFKVESVLQEQELNGQIDIKVDVLNGNANIVGLFNDLFLKYDGTLYLSYLKHNYSFDENFLSHLIDVLSSSLLSTSEAIVENETKNETSLDSEELLNNLILEKDGSNVTVKLNIESEDMKKEVSFYFLDIEQGTLLKSIEVKDVNNDDFFIKLTPTNKKITYSESTYNDLSSSTWLVDELIEISQYEAFTLHFDYSLEDYPLDVDVNIASENKININFKISSLDESREIDLYYIDSKYYLELDNYMIEATQEDIDLIVSLISEYLSFSEESNGEVELIEESEEVDLYSLIYDVVGVISMVDENTMSIPLSLSLINELLIDTEVLISIENESLKCNLKEYGVDLFVYEFEDDIVLPLNKVIYNRESLDDINYHVDNIENILSKESIQLDFSDLSIKNGEQTYYLDGRFNKNNVDYSFELELSGNIQMKLRITYLNNKYYLSFGEDSYSVNLVLSPKQMETFFEYIDEIFNYIFDGNDFNVSFEDFIKDIVVFIEQVINGELDVSIGELVYKLVSILDSSYLEIDQRNIIVKFDETSIELFKLSDNYMLIVEQLSYQDYQIDGEIYLKERDYQISVDTSSFIDISEIFEDLNIPFPETEE